LASTVRQLFSLLEVAHVSDIARVKRELTGELAVDMISLLTRCQSALEKTGVMKDSNLPLLLRGFLEERVMCGLS
jgi:hypothetical protein